MKRISGILTGITLIVTATVAQAEPWGRVMAAPSPDRSMFGQAATGVSAAFPAPVAPALSQNTGETLRPGLLQPIYTDSSLFDAGLPNGKTGTRRPLAPRPVPEPQTLSLIGSVLLPLLGLYRRRR